MKHVWWAAFAAAVLGAAPAAAQTGLAPAADPGGRITVGLGVAASRPGGDLATGGGIGLSLGYQATQAVSLFVRGGTGYGGASAEAGARYTFGAADAALRPYVELAGAHIRATHDGLRGSGLGVSAGAGVEYALSRSVSLDLGVVRTQGRFRAGDFDGDPYASTRLNLGLRLRF